ncbi:Gfo/Idh/MocA family oxidoreductase [Schleiferiaceae bacterium]|nr:Gfo/Idh/MocA family oxidoreductase [Schleiferiaceae bacterium]
MKVLIIGLGSIAQKHIASLKALERDCEVYALRSNKSSPMVEGVINCYSLKEVPSDLGFIIISNPTSMHLQTIKEVVYFDVPLFIEKPPIDNLEDAKEVLKLVEKLELPTYTAFNLRFHPVIQWLKDNIDSHRIIEINTYCGSYLPDWRPNKDYRQVYSAREELGGGVHLDLSHEIDYMIWILGYPVSAKSIKRKLSDLEISSVDSAKYWMEYENFTTSVTLNYFRRDSKRVIEVLTSKTTLECDLLLNKVTDLRTSEVVFESKEFTNIDTYARQMNYFLNCIQSKNQPMNSLSESMRTMEVCLK